MRPRTTSITRRAGARKLLMRKREIERLIGATQRAGITVVPLSIYFNERGIAKVQLGLAKGKRKVDKRATEKDTRLEARAVAAAEPPHQGSVSG